jgi:hypothetical protein
VGKTGKAEGVAPVARLEARGSPAFTAQSATRRRKRVLADQTAAEADGYGMRA